MRNLLYVSFGTDSANCTLEAKIRYNVTSMVIMKIQNSLIDILDPKIIGDKKQLVLLIQNIELMI